MRLYEIKKLQCVKHNVCTPIQMKTDFDISKWHPQGEGLNRQRQYRTLLQYPVFNLWSCIPSLCVLKKQTISYGQNLWETSVVQVLTLLVACKNIYLLFCHQSSAQECLGSDFHLYSCPAPQLYNSHLYFQKAFLPFCSRSMLFWRKSPHSCMKLSPVCSKRCWSQCVLFLSQCISTVSSSHENKRRSYKSAITVTNNGKLLCKKLSEVFLNRDNWGAPSHATAMAGYSWIAFQNIILFSHFLR